MPDETRKVRIAFDPADDDEIGKVRELPADEARRKVTDGWAVYVDDEAEDEEPSAWAGLTVAAVLDKVGEDQAYAAEALEYENAQDQPRVTLVGQLQAIVDGDAGGEDGGDGSDGQQTAPSV